MSAAGRCDGNSLRVHVWDIFIVQHMLGKYMCQQVLGMYVNDICLSKLRVCLHALLSLRVHVWIYASSASLCGSGNPHWAAALIRIQPRGTSRPPRWLGIRDGERKRVKWWWVRKRKSERQREREVFSLLVNSLLMSLIPLSRGSSWPPSHNIH